MNFYNIRIVVFILVILICYLFIKKYIKRSNANVKFNIGLKIIVVLFLIRIYPTIVYNIQPENLFLRFKNVEKAMQYSFLDNKIINVIDGSKCVYVLYEKESGERTYTHFVKNKDKIKFKSPKDYTTKIILYKEYIITIEKTKKEETLIGIRRITFEDIQLEITDSKNSRFHNIDDIQQDLHIYERYTILDELPNDYYIEINGEKYQINNYMI